MKQTEIPPTAAGGRGQIQATQKVVHTVRRAANGVAV